MLGVKSAKDGMFFLNQEEAESSKAPSKKSQTARDEAALPREAENLPMRTIWGRKFSRPSNWVHTLRSTSTGSHRQVSSPFTDMRFRCISIGSNS